MFDENATDEDLENDLAKVAIDCIALNGLELASNGFPYFAQHYLDRIALKYPDEIERRTAIVRELYKRPIYRKGCPDA